MAGAADTEQQTRSTYERAFVRQTYLQSPLSSRRGVEANDDDDDDLEQL